MTRSTSLPAFATVRGILFDFGGTLDGDGSHWLDRFCELYRQLGLPFSREQVRTAFDFAERESLGGDALGEASLEEMVERHVAWQFSSLQVTDSALQSEVVRQFVAPIRRVAQRNLRILSELTGRGYRLGVISNGCGNTAQLCAELGYAPFFDFVLDSTRIGLRKPDPKFHRLAAGHLGLAPAEILMIGDSFERDIKPASALGMRTVWLTSEIASPDEADAVADSLPQLLQLLPARARSAIALKAGIFAAGQGSRLRSAGQLKPLVRLGGRPMIGHVLEGFAEVGIGEIAIIINEEAAEVRRAVSARRWPFALRWIVKTTPSSMESFLRVIEALAADGSGGPFLLSTVDTVLLPGALSEFFDQAGANGSDLTLAINAPAEDDKPLWVRCAADNARVEAIGEAAAGSGLATAGLYAVRPTILREAAEARRDQVGSLREFLGRLIERGYAIDALRIGNSVDVDRPSDIIAAEELVSRKAP